MVKKKPVIYFYPEKKTDIAVSLEIKGEFTFTYPEYKNGWNFSAEPNGTINMNGKTYNYLFWEGESDFSYEEINSEEGYMVESDTLLNFFENSLSAMGLNTKETQDFITFWYPIMKKNPRNYIHFVFNEAYNRDANLSVTPKPDNSLRLFMYWAFAPNMDKQLKKQKFPEFKRQGFSLVEWGGAELEHVSYKVD
ncbi:MAG: hypothetical protein IAF38_02980 [Bacteroidia bacterium]|nr:hypothetical protein [Bacteroidia bacterium]